MRKFKFLIAPLLLIFVVGLIGCSKSNELTGNQKFVQTFEKSINTRWDKQNKSDNSTTSDKTIQILENEIETLESDLPGIDDPVLKKNAEDYIEGVKLQIEALKTNDYNLEYDYTNESNNLRKPALISMVEVYGVSIDKAHEQTYKDFKASAQVIVNENKAKKYAEELASTMKFERIDEEYNSLLTTILENTSEYNFSSLSFKIQYKDADGVIIGDDSIYLSDFEPGNKEKIEVSLYGNSKDFSSLLIKLSDFYLK